MNTRFDTHQRKLLPFRMKLAEPDSSGQLAGTVEGYAAAFGNIDLVGDMILPGAFADGLSKFLDEGFVAFNHDWDMPIGKPVDAKEDSYGLWTKNAISDTTTGRDVMTLARDGVVRKMSIGYRIPKDGAKRVNRAELSGFLATVSWPEAQKVDILDQFDKLGWGECYLISKINLYEASLVTIPANPNAIVTSAKNALLDGVSFDEHSAVVRAALEEFTARVKSLRELRQGDGRDLSTARKNFLSEQADALQSVADELRALAKTGANGNELARLYAETLLTESRRLGADV